jgi:hypothetical protein
LNSAAITRSGLDLQVAGMDVALVAQALAQRDRELGVGGS